MSVSLEQFAQEVEKDLDHFVKLWKRKHEESPEDYPLEFDDDNSGLWFEFFLLSMDDEEV